MEQLNSKKKLKAWITFSRQWQVGDVTLQRNATRIVPCVHGHALYCSVNVLVSDFVIPVAFVVFFNTLCSSFVRYSVFFFMPIVFKVKCLLTEYCQLGLCRDHGYSRIPWGIFNPRGVNEIFFFFVFMGTGKCTPTDAHNIIQHPIWLLICIHPYSHAPHNMQSTQYNSSIEYF